MKTALSLAAVLALGCASTAFAQSERYGTPYDQPSSQSQSDQYGQDQNQNPNGQTNPGYGNEPNDQYNQNGQYDQDQKGQYNENTQGQYNDQQYNDESGMAPPGNLDRDEVRNLQLKLRDEGYDPGRPDGSWGQQTASALADFQRANGIEPTGNLDKRTVRALGLPPDEGYGGERRNDQYQRGQYGNDLDNPDMNNNPDNNNQNPNDNDQNNPH